VSICFASLSAPIFKLESYFLTIGCSMMDATPISSMACPCQSSLMKMPIPTPNLNGGEWSASLSNGAKYNGSDLRLQAKLPMSLFVRLYRSLPVIKQLTAIQEQLGGLQQHFRIVETAAVIQAMATLQAGDPRYRDPKRLLAHGAQYWSQNYEDGMIAEIFRRIGTVSKTFLEIGVETAPRTTPRRYCPPAGAAIGLRPANPAAIPLLRG